MPSTDQPIYSYDVDHTALEIIVKDDIAKQTQSASSEQRHLRPHCFIDPLSRLIIAVAWDIQATHPLLSTNDFSEEGS